MSKQERQTQNQETRYYKTPNYGLRRLVALGLIGLGAAGGIHAMNNNNDRSDRPVKPEAVAMGHVDKSITSLTIEDGARIRKDPFIPDTESAPNLVKELELEKPVEVKTNGKAVVASKTADGSWYGVPAESLKRIDPDLELEGDSDGYVWINQQRATPEKSDPDKDSNP